MWVAIVSSDAEIIGAVRRAIGDDGVRTDVYGAVSTIAELPDVLVVDDEAAVVAARARDAAIPVLLVTTPGDAHERISGLRVGADDAVPSDVVQGQMAARVSALSRRGMLVSRDATAVCIDGCSFDLERGTYTRDADTKSLTAKEVAILRWLLRHRGRPVPRAELLENVWGASPDMITKTVDVTIHNLRKKIERESSSPRIVQSIKGLGYVVP